MESSGGSEITANGDKSEWFRFDRNRNDSSGLTAAMRDRMSESIRHVQAGAGWIKPRQGTAMRESPLLANAIAYK
jgi:hypothetical protein